MEKRADIGIRGQDFFGHCPQCGTSCEDEIISLANKFCEGFVAEAGDESNNIWYEIVEEPVGCNRDNGDYWAWTYFGHICADPFHNDPCENRPNTYGSLFEGWTTYDPRGVWTPMILGGGLDEGDGYTGLGKGQFQSNQRWKLTNNCNYDSYTGCGKPVSTTIPGQYGSPTFAGSITVEEYHNGKRQVELGTCYPLDPRCSETVLDADGNPVTRGGTTILGKVYDVFNIQNQFDIFPVCGEMEVQDSGDYYYEFERAGTFQSLDSTNELFFLLLKSVCSDTSISERSQHPHIVGTNSRSSGNFWINRGENRSRQFDNHEEVKKIGLRREISVAKLGSITEVYTCEECEYNNDWPHEETQECVNIITKYRVSPVSGSLLYGATYDTLEEAFDDLKSEGGIPFFGSSSYLSGMGKAAYKYLGREVGSGLLCDSQVLAYGKTTVTPLSLPSDPQPAEPSSSWNRYLYSNPGLPEDLESTLGREVRISYGIGAVLQGLNGAINLNGFNVSTNDDAFDLSSTEKYYPVSGYSLIGVEFYQAHLSYNSDGAAINKEWPLEFTRIYQKQLDFNGKTIDIPPMTTTITLK